MRYGRNMTSFLLVFLGGGIGAGGRHLVSLWTLRQFGPAFPLGTLLVNIFGSLAMGLLIGWLVHRGGASNNMRLFFATGVLGGFTTFSAFSLDFANLWERGALGEAALYVVLSVALSIFAVFIGLWLARTVLTA